MRYRRLVLRSGPDAVGVGFHPRLTVVGGAGADERTALAAELLGALAGGSGPGELEIVDDRGRALLITRGAADADDRIVEVETEADVSNEFRRPDGRIDLLRRFDLTVPAAARQTRLTAADVAVARRNDLIVQRLARCHQPSLWAAADRLRDAWSQLAAAERALHDEPESDDVDRAVAEAIERCRLRLARAIDRDETIRASLPRTLGVLLLCAAATALASRVAPIGEMAALGYLGTALLALVWAVWCHRRVERAAQAEAKAASAAGATSYLGHHIERVDALIEHERRRHTRADAAAAAHEAQLAWEELAGDASVDWVVAHRERIEAASREPTGVETADLAHAFVARLASLRHAGEAGENLPLILDEPLAGVDLNTKIWILELLARSAGAPQVIYVTEDPEVADWARVEALDGHLELLEPERPPADAGAADAASDPLDPTTTVEGADERPRAEAGERGERPERAASLRLASRRGRAPGAPHRR